MSVHDFMDNFTAGLAFGMLSNSLYTSCRLSYGVGFYPAYYTSCCPSYSLNSVFYDNYSYMQVPDYVFPAADGYSACYDIQRQGFAGIEYQFKSPDSFYNKNIVEPYKNAMQEYYKNNSDSSKTQNYTFNPYFMSQPFQYATPSQFLEKYTQWPSVNKPSDTQNKSSEEKSESSEEKSNNDEVKSKSEADNKSNKTNTKVKSNNKTKTKNWESMSDSEMKATYGNYSQNITNLYNGTASDLNRFLKGKGKLEGKGQAFIDAQNRYGISASVLAAIAVHESGDGKSRLAKKQNNVGGVRIPGSNKFKTYSDIAACIMDMARFLKTGYADKGLQTLYQVNAKYCPITDKTDKKHTNAGWAKAVSGNLREIEA